MDDLGLEYWAITDHSKSSFQANGLDAKRLREQIKEIKKINEKFAGARQRVPAVGGHAKWTF